MAPLPRVAKLLRPRSPLRSRRRAPPPGRFICQRTSLAMGSPTERMLTCPPALAPSTSLSSTVSTDLSRTGCCGLGGGDDVLVAAASLERLSGTVAGTSCKQSHGVELCIMSRSSPNHVAITSGRKARCLNPSGRKAVCVNPSGPKAGCLNPSGRKARRVNPSGWRAGRFEFLGAECWVFESLRGGRLCV
jgi:hypothetical protein